jgi:large subunit ribosomal protein L31
MKQGIHPDYKEVEVTCACGETFKTRAVKPDGEIKVEICKNCHPFYTGVRKMVDTGGRVERFNKRLGKDKK